jgi:tRNA 2-thiouridine synthesizing protein A
MAQITVDARGLSCPQPVLLAGEEMDKAGSGELAVLVDNDASRENVGRAAVAKGWQVTADAAEADGNFRLVLHK